ncbi:MAG TPA: hypothetical protein VGO57_01670 [Verrucomicrobiae bacterium]|jgi:hypothetical protein
MNKSGFYILVVLIGVIELAMLWRQSEARAKLRAENQTLELQAGQMTALVAENRHLTQNISAAADVTSIAGQQMEELNRLRNEVEARQRQIQDLQAELAVQPTLPAFQSLSGSNRFVNLTKESWASSGYSTPEAALETMLWATLHGDVATVRASLTPVELARRNNGAWKNKTDSEIANAGMQGLSQVSGLQILNLQMMSEDDAHFTLYVSGLKQSDQPLWVDMKLIDGEWKSDGSEHRMVGQ